MILLHGFLTELRRLEAISSSCPAYGLPSSMSSSKEVEQGKRKDHVLKALDEMREQLNALANRVDGQGSPPLRCAVTSY